MCEPGTGQDTARPRSAFRPTMFTPWDLVEVIELMYLVETLIANAQKQIELAPSLEENPDPGANWTPRGNPDSDVRPNMVSKCVDGLNRAGDVPILKAVEFGKTR